MSPLRVLRRSCTGVTPAARHHHHLAASRRRASSCVMFQQHQATSSLVLRTAAAAVARRWPATMDHQQSRRTMASTPTTTTTKATPPSKNADNINTVVDDRAAHADLFAQYAKKRNGVWTLNTHDVAALLEGIGRGQAVCEDNQWTTIDNVDDACGDGNEVLIASPLIQQLFTVADMDGNGLIDLEEFLENAYTFMGSNPARIIILAGGPGAGKGVLSRRLEQECHVVHLSSGELLREEVEQDTVLGRQVQGIMERGELVSSALIVALMKKKMRHHPGARVLLDGFPRSVENAQDLLTLCGRPELALHLICDDTVMMERIMKRGQSSHEQRADDNFTTALDRIRTYRKYHDQTMAWLRQQHVPIINLDCEGSAESVWQQLVAIGRLMRPAVKLTSTTSSSGGGLFGGE